MRALEFLREAPKSQGNLGNNPMGLTADVVAKIKSLPNNKQTQRIIQQVKDLLDNVDVGTSLEVYKQRLEPIAQDDADVEKAINQLTNLIAAAAAQTSVKDRDFLIKKWSADQIVKLDRLKTAGTNYTVTQLFNYYGKSPAITFIVDSLSKVEGYGMGKGEVVFAVLSKSITKAQKGDLEIQETSPDGKTSTFKIEVKATDGGSPRFSDQEVKTGPGYETMRDELEEKYKEPLTDMKAIKSTGVNITNWIALGQRQEIDKQVFYTDTLNLLEKIFPNQDNVDLATLISQGKEGSAKAMYANKTFTRYMSIKDDDVVMYINFAKTPPTYTIFTTVEDLEKMGMRFHAETIYILGQGSRSVYPQMGVKNQ